MNTIFSIGHGRRAFSEFLQVLKKNKIDILVDVRTFPRSRFCPQFNRSFMSAELQNVGIVYEFRGDQLGGLGENINYDEAIDEITNMAKKGKRVCVCCSETDYKKCHRHTMLEPSFGKNKIKVKHLGLISGVF